MRGQNRTSDFLLHDAFIVAVSVGIAVFLVKTEILATALASAQELEFIGSFVAGLFFTSVFTTAPAIVTLGEIARANSILLVSLFGAMGAVVGDLIIFHFIRDRFSKHLLELAKHRKTTRRVRALLKMRLFRWLSFFVGGLIIASPFPDELGISMLGFSKMRTSWFIPLSFAFNFLGILAIGLVASTL